MSKKKKSTGEDFVENIVDPSYSAQQYLGLVFRALVPVLGSPETHEVSTGLRSDLRH